MLKMAGSNKVVVNLVPLYGADGQRHVSSLLTIGDTQILLDCGWTEEFNVADLAALKSVSSTVDAVLISQPDLEHCGGMPYLYGRLGCKAPAYMSMPTNRFGQLLMYDCYLSIAAENPEFNAFTLEDVKHAFDLTSFGGPSVQLRYLEEAGVKGGQVTVSASNSGHMLGGSVWRITKATETVVYAPVFNHKNEKHLAKAAISTLFKMPSAVITGASAGTDLLAAATGSTSAGSGSAVPGLAPGAVGGPAGGDDGNADRVKSDKDVVARDMVDTCLQSLRQGGNVLIPCDTAGRVLEVLLRLDGAFGMHHHFPIYFLNHVAPNVLDFAKTLLEYMTDRITREFTDYRSVPFDFRPERSRIRTATAMAEVRAAASQGPIVVVTTFPTLTTGFARQLFNMWAGSDRNTILFTSKELAAPDSIAGQLLAQPTPKSISVDVYSVVPLTGYELKRHRDSKEEEQRKAARAVAAARARAEEAAELAEAGVGSVVLGTTASSAAVGGPAGGEAISSSAGADADAAMVGGLQSPSALAASANNQSVDNLRTGDDMYCDDEDMVMELEYADDAIASRIAAPANDTGGHRGKMGFYRKGLAARFPMFSKDQHYSHAAARSVASASSKPGAMGPDTAAIERFANFRSLNTDYGQTINPADLEESEADKVATGSGLAHGTMLPVNSGLPSSIANRLGRDRDRRGGAGAGAGRGRDGKQQDAEPEIDEFGRVREKRPDESDGIGEDGEPLPTKRVKATATVRINCKVHYFPLEGRSDAMSVLNVLEETEPLKLVFIHSSLDAAAAMAGMAQRFCRHVYMPTQGELVDLSSNTAQVSMRISGLFYQSIGLQKLGAHDVAFVNAEMAPVRDLSVAATAATLTITDQVSMELEGAGSSTLGTINEAGMAEGLVLAHPGTSGAAPSFSSASGSMADDDEAADPAEAGHAAVLLRPGPVRAGEIRRRLKAAGVESQILDGVVVTSGGMLVRRLDAGPAAGGGRGAGFGLEIEGPASSEYFAVRRALYDLYTLV